ncbi:B12-binding domain-containing radical SAM protein [Candidatus Woesearchaeota archaeon]|nr:B12-binding domain-containing radical SAM protein [Candidatus Woesearchaeota archaeon]
MKVLFVYTNVEKSIQEPLGLAYLSGMLKHHGIETFLWDNTFETKEDLKLKLEEINPDFVAFSCLSSDYDYMSELAQFVKSIKNVPIIVGGHHVTFKPEDVIANPFIDVIIRGEGEETLLDYVQNQDVKTLGTWVKRDNVVYMNPMRQLPDVNKLPWPDHSMFEKHFEKKVVWVKDAPVEKYGIFITSRGCPFNCFYCSNKRMQDLYHGQKFTRYRDIQDVMNELKFFIKKYNFSHVYFQDETLTTNKERIYEFCEIYKKEIGLPWHAEARVDTVDYDLLKTMADAGCEVLMMGIESGSERIRKELLGRHMSDEMIINAFQDARKVGIKASSFNICGIPTETKEDILKTIELNKKCNPAMGKMTIFNVLPGTPLEDYCNKNGYYIRRKFPTNYYVDSNIKHETFTLKELMEFRKMFVEAMGGYSGATKEGEF